MNTRLIKVIALAAVFAGGWALSAFAGSTEITFGSHAYLPEADGFECVMSRGVTTNGTLAFVSYNSTFLDFGELVEAGPAAGGTGYGWWKSPDQDFFVCDLKPVGGVGIPHVTFHYDEGDNPNSVAPHFPSRLGLGYKGTVTAVATKANPPGSPNPTQDIVTFGNKVFAEVDQIIINPTILFNNNAWGRIYFGLAFFPDPNDPPTNPPPANAQPFTGLDHWGHYRGTITATVTW